MSKKRILGIAVLYYVGIAGISPLIKFLSDRFSLFLSEFDSILGFVFLSCVVVGLLSGVFFVGKKPSFKDGFYLGLKIVVLHFLIMLIISFPMMMVAKGVVQDFLASGLFYIYLLSLFLWTISPRMISLLWHSKNDSV
jgi:hypothetical protein